MEEWRAITPSICLGFTLSSPCRQVTPSVMFGVGVTGISSAHLKEVQSGLVARLGNGLAWQARSGGRKVCTRLTGEQRTLAPPLTCNSLQASWSTRFAQLRWGRSRQCCALFIAQGGNSTTALLSSPTTAAQSPRCCHRPASKSRGQSAVALQVQRNGVRRMDPSLAREAEIVATSGFVDEPIEALFCCVGRCCRRSKKHINVGSWPASCGRARRSLICG